uniref:Uncharacterized protein n=1 Tax=Anopheles braziliensis TaxID=58242 RepID=A0A2M3ZLS8_9DIPT
MVVPGWWWSRLLWSSVLHSDPPVRRKGATHSDPLPASSCYRTIVRLSLLLGTAAVRSFRSVVSSSRTRNSASVRNFSHC